MNVGHAVHLDAREVDPGPQRSTTAVGPGPDEGPAPGIEHAFVLAPSPEPTPLDTEKSEEVAEARADESSRSSGAGS